MDLNLRNKTVLITGASAGIGKSFAEVFFKKGFNFFNLDIVHKERLYGETRIYNWLNLPKISFNNFIGI